MPDIYGQRREPKNRAKRSATITVTVPERFWQNNTMCGCLLRASCIAPSPVCSSVPVASSLVTFFSGISQRRLHIVEVLLRPRVVRRVCVYGLFEAGKGVFVLFIFHLQVADVVVGGRLAAGFLKCDESVFAIPDPVEGEAEIVADAAVLRIDGEGLEEGLRRLIEPAREITGYPEVIVNCRRIRLDRQCFQVGSFRLGVMLPPCRK